MFIFRAFLAAVLSMSLCTISNGQVRPKPLRPALPAARPVSPQVTQPTKRNTAPPVQKKASSNKSTKPDANSKDKKQSDQSNADSKDDKPEPEKVTVKNEEELEKLLDAKPNPPKPEDAAEKAKREAAEKAKRQKQITQIKKLKFDRRASTALRIWSTPEKNESEEKKDDPSKAATAETDPNATKPTTEDAKFAQGLLDLQQHVTLGNWDEVKQFLSSLPEEMSKATYEHLLSNLARGPAGQTQNLANNPNIDPALVAILTSTQGRGPGARFREKNFYALSDIFGLIDAAPAKLEKNHISSLGRIIGHALTLGHDIEKLLERLQQESQKTESQLLTKRQCAQLLVSAGQLLEAGAFLPTPEEAREKDDREGLNLLSRFAMAKYAEEKKTEFLEQAWHSTQAALAVGKVDESEKQEALRRAVELAPKIRDELGDQWLNDSFTNRVDRGKEILAAIGTGTSISMQTYPTTPSRRLRGIQLQKTAVEALLKAAPEKATEWKDQLMLLANNWLREAQFSYEQSKSSSLRPQMQRDIYGNYFYSSRSYSYNTSRNGSPIETPEMIENRPSDQWLTILDESIQPRFSIMFAQLYLKVNEEEKAFPYIEAFAKDQPKKALELANEFLKVWTTNHDPNANRNRTNYYMFSYGYNPRASGIPLTRSKQERNLEELSKWVSQLRSLPIGDLDEALLVQAFTKSHSRAEVYRVESLEKVFGSIDQLEPKTLAEMVQSMRGNLAGVWRNPALQKDSKTKRKKADMEAEVMRGYSVAKSVLTKGLEKYPEDWRLVLAKACILHDENDYQQELQKSSQFAERRNEAMALFQSAAQKYAATLSEVSEDDETTSVYEFWYYASLGAVDLGRIRKTDSPDLRQMANIRTALESLSGPASERHVAKFANSLFTRMSSLKPELKFRYLRTGFEIVGNHKQADEAKKVYQYYKDLVTEIKLETEIDGPDKIGHEQPFGVWVNLVHTKEIERESGGFSKYLQNQNNSYYSYNYGRPTENYRDKFQEAATKTLSEQFDVLSVTFNDPKTTSHASKEYGWRITPYAYILLKARGPEVDKVPSLQLDLDFLDTSGYAIIPVESATLPIDAKQPKQPARPYDQLKIVQTLDERQADEGKLILEVKATANGLVPDLDEITTLKFDEFEVSNLEDENVSVSRFDQERKETAIASERIWMITLQAKEGLAQIPTEFTFPATANDLAEFTYRRYVDADLEEVEATLPLIASYGSPRPIWPWIVAAVVVFLAVMLGVIAWIRRPQRQTSEVSTRLPSEINAFTIIGFLKEIQRNNGFSDNKKVELDESIRNLERHYFAGTKQDELDLKRLAEQWLRQSA